MNSVNETQCLSERRVSAGVVALFVALFADFFVGSVKCADLFDRPLYDVGNLTRDIFFSSTRELLKNFQHE